MSKLSDEITQLSTDINRALDRLDFKDLEVEAMRLRALTTDQNFWDDNLEAQRVSQRLARLDHRLGPWRDLKKDVGELVELFKLNDASLEPDLSVQLAKCGEGLATLKDDLKLAGPYDADDAIITIQAGAGGTDAQDWAQRLLRMYLRYAERGKLSTKLIQESTGDEAGIKSATFEVNGDYAYGKLKGEHGVHRLVRQSPFNSGATRETSFAKVEVIPKIDQPDDVEIDDKDLKIDVYRSGGHGGQSVNTTDSAVRVTHLPTGIVVAIQNERSQLQNRDVAMTILRSKLAQLQIEQHAEKVSELKAPTGANEFGSQIRNYVLHPYKQVKDLRTNFQSSDPEAVLEGGIDGFIDAYLDSAATG